MGNTDRNKQYLRNKLRRINQLLKRFKIPSVKKEDENFSFNGKKLLFFESDKFIAEIYKTRLEKSGYKCVVYNNPPADKEKLIRLILNENPDLILTEIIMPGIDGFSEIEILKSDDRTKNFPIMIHSNLGRSEDIEKGIKFGAVDYFVPQTLMPQDMVDAIGRFFNNPKDYKPRYLNFINK